MTEKHRIKDSFILDLPALVQAPAVDLPNVLEMRNAAQELCPTLNQGQLAVADSVLEALQNNNHMQLKFFSLMAQVAQEKPFFTIISVSYTHLTLPTILLV